MNCMKCGRSIGPDQVFCEDCLQAMEKYPVNPDTPVMLPPRALNPGVKRPAAHHRKTRKPEEIIRSLRSWVMILAVLVVTLILAFAMSVTIVLRLMDQAPPTGESAGQNYSTGDIGDIPAS